MTKVLILTQGNLAHELLTTARTIAGPMPNFVALDLGWNDTIEEGRRKIEDVLGRLDPQAEVLILTDMFGGTPSNVALSFYQPGRVEIITGVNLPMVVRLGCLELAEPPVAELAQWIQQKGQASICRPEAAAQDSGDEEQ